VFGAFAIEAMLKMKPTRRSVTGFSLVELVIVIALILIALGVAVLSLRTALASGRVNSGVQTVLSQLRLAHQESMDRRMQYSITFTAPGTIVTQRIVQGQAPVTERTITLPSEVQFIAPPGLPNPGPDGFGTGQFAIDFDQVNGGGGNIIFFVPDGTALDTTGGPNDGVIYIGHARGLAPTHAISMWGATGRFKVWNLANGKGGPKWN
jgi:type II secretory pathway pseudopilin PulG